MSKSTQHPTYRDGVVEVGFAMVDWTIREEVPGTLTAYLTVNGDIQVCSVGIDKRINFILTDEQRVDLIQALGGIPDADGVSAHERSEGA